MANLKTQKRKEATKEQNFNQCFLKETDTRTKNIGPFSSVSFFVQVNV